MTNEEITTLRDWYHAELQIMDNGYALPVPAAQALLEKLEALNAKVIVDAGAGFSTVLLNRWVKGRAKIYTFDHDAKWLDRVERLLQKQNLSTVYLRNLSPITVNSLPVVDVILIDHGPTMADRLAYLPRFVRRLAPGGVLALDDWRFSYRTHAASALAKLGFSCEAVPGTRLCFATRDP